MAKRLLLLIVLSLMVSVAPMTLADSDCDHSASNYARAVQLHDAGDYDRALFHYDCALQNDPDNTIIPLLIENVHEDIATAGDAWSRKPEPATAQVTCDHTRDQAGLGADAYARGEMQLALIRLQCALLLDPQQVDVLELLGQIYISRGETHTAQHYFNRAEAARAAQAEAPADEPFIPDWLRPYEMMPLEAAPPARTPWSLSAPARRDSADTVTVTLWLRHQPAAQAAAPQLSSDIPAEPRAGLSASEFAGFADWFVKRGDLARAAVALSKALELEPLRHDLRCRLGVIHESAGDAVAALAAFDHVLSQDPGDICANGHRRALMRSMNAAATTSAEAATPAAVSPAHETYERGMRFLEARKLYAAAHTLIEALKLDPAHTAARCQLGAVYSKWGNYGRALQELRSVLDADAENACAWQQRKLTVTKMLNMYVPLAVDDFFYRARAFARIDEWAAARDEFERGLALDPSRKDVRCELGMLYDKLGDHQAALAAFDRVLADNIDDSCAWSNREGLMQRLRGE